MQQIPFTSGKHHPRYSHGGILRRKRSGRGQRPLSTRAPLHLVFKADRTRLRTGLRGYRSHPLVHHLIEHYARKFRVKIEQVSVQGDHMHLLVRTSRRSNFHSFFRVLAGQIAQQFEREGHLRTAMTDTPARRVKRRAGRVLERGTGLWKVRPFTRVVWGWRAYSTVRDYIQLNEKEALGHIPYRKERLRGLSREERRILWQ